jgi:hypothetical protein
MTVKTLPLLSARWRSALAVSSLLLVFWPVPGGVGQNPPPQTGIPGTPQLPADAVRDGANPMAGLNSAKLAHMREDDRRKRLLEDTTKLVELSNELKTYVEKTPKDALSLDVVRKAAEIEKLAHDVKERMKS